MGAAIALALVAQPATAHAATPIWTLSQDAVVRSAVTVGSDQLESVGGEQGVTGPAGAETSDALKADVAKRVAQRVKAGKLGGNSSIKIIDVLTGEEIYSNNAATSRTVASNTKLLTAVAALQTVGGSTRFATKVSRQGKRSIYFESGGDPRLTKAKIKRLAKGTAAILKKRGVKRGTITVRLDDTIFTGATKHATWRQGGYNLATIQPVRGTAIAGVRSADSAAAAARLFASYLDRSLPTKVKVRYAGRKATPAAAKAVAAVSSSTVRTLVKRMLLRSDNQVAEVLHRHIGIAAGQAGSFAGGAAGTLAAIRALGVPTAGVSLKDGSGLSPRDTMSAEFLVSLLAVIADPANKALRPILYSGTALPTSGLSGTLIKGYGRFTSSKSKCAVGAVAAKTGTLDYEIALSGFTVGSDGRLKALSIAVNSVRGAAKTKARIAMDEVAAAVAGSCAADS
ncbi:hypothetical protein GCM10010407_14380 [Rarobacter incanus]